MFSLKSIYFVAFELLKNFPNYVSGESIAKSISVSRVAVKKAIDLLINQGFEIESLPRVGYRLVKLPKKPVEPAVYGLLKLRGFEKNIFYKYFEKIDSTQNEALRFYSKNRYGLDNETFYIFAAEEQTNGLGRFQRYWHSPKGGLWMTILSRAAIQAGKIPLFPLGVALSIVEVLRKYEINPLLKWPNDIMVGDKKIAGILATARTEIDLASHIFTGIGINVNNEVPSEIRADATSMRKILGREIDILQLMVEVIEQVIPLYSEINSAKIIRRANEILYKKNQKALISLPSGEKIEAIIRKISSNGELIAEINGTKKTFYAAEIDKP